MKGFFIGEGGERECRAALWEEREKQTDRQAG